MPGAQVAGAGGRSNGQEPESFGRAAARAQRPREPPDRRIGGRPRQPSRVPAPWLGHRAFAAADGAHPRHRRPRPGRRCPAGARRRRDDPRGAKRAGGHDRPRADRRWRRHHRAVAGRREPGAVGARLHRAAAACRELVAERGRHRLDVQAAQRREIPQRQGNDGRRRRRQHGPPRRPGERLERAVGLLGPAEQGRHAQGRRSYGRVPPRGRERQLPVHGLDRQLQRRDHPRRRARATSSNT